MASLSPLQQLGSAPTLPPAGKMVPALPCGLGKTEMTKKTKMKVKMKRRKKERRGKRGNAKGGREKRLKMGWGGSGEEERQIEEGKGEGEGKEQGQGKKRGKEEEKKGEEGGRGALHCCACATQCCSTCPAPLPFDDEALQSLQHSAAPKQTPLPPAPQ